MSFGEPTFGKVTSEQKAMAQMCHMSALAGVIVVGLAMPLGPLLVWQMKRHLGEFVDAQGKEALNFQITYWILTLLLAPLVFISEYLWLLPIAVVVYAGVMSIIGGMKAAEGEMYQYPATIRMVR